MIRIWEVREGNASCKELEGLTMAGEVVDRGDLMIKWGMRESCILDGLFALG